jgi:simple sugar transport system ATP-binding protein
MATRSAAFRSAFARVEIVGIAGIEGNGQTELIEALSGLVSARRERSVLRDRILQTGPLASSRNSVSPTFPKTAHKRASC